MIVLFAAKGGSGATVTACALALSRATRSSTLLIDLAGDVPVTLGLPAPCGPGVSEWLASATADQGALLDIAVPVTDHLSVVPSGTATAEAARWRDLAPALAGLHDVIVDAGTGHPPAPLVEAAQHVLLVTRACFVSISRARALGVHPTGIVLINEPGRALRARDVEHALGAPVVADVPIDPAVARAVDAGLLAARLPRSLSTPLRGAA